MFNPMSSPWLQPHKFCHIQNIDCKVLCNGLICLVAVFTVTFQKQLSTFTSPSVAVRQKEGKTIDIKDLKDLTVKFHSNTGIQVATTRMCFSY